MELICTHCKKILGLGLVVLNVTLYKNELYHNLCYDKMISNNNELDLCGLYKSFPEIDQDVLRALFETYGSNKTEGSLGNGWCLITEGIHENVESDIGMDSFPSKEELSAWLSETIYETMSEDYGWKVLYILHKGEVVSNSGDFLIS